MTSDKKNPKGIDAEYQYTDETLGQEVDLDAHPENPNLNSFKDRILTKLPKKKMGLIFFILVAVFVAYKFFSAGTPTTPSTKEVLSQELTKPVATSTTVVTPAPAPVAVVTVAPTPAVLEYQPTSSEPSAELKNLQSGVDQINANMTQMEAALLTITNSLINLSGRMSAVEKEQKIAKKARFTMYYVHSLLPQRAWLHTSREHFTTVKVGDVLPGYGQIEKIDDTTGIVMTSSGREIHYGKYDS